MSKPLNLPSVEVEKLFYFETGDERYQWLNDIVAFAVLGCPPNGNICYNAYLVK